MAVLALHLASIASALAVATQDVLARRDQLEVAMIHAEFVPAEMVNVHPFRDHAARELKCDAVGVVVAAAVANDSVSDAGGSERTANIRRLIGDRLWARTATQRGRSRFVSSEPLVGDRDQRPAGRDMHAARRELPDAADRRRRLTVLSLIAESLRDLRVGEPRPDRLEHPRPDCGDSYTTVICPSCARAYQAQRRICNSAVRPDRLGSRDTTTSRTVSHPGAAQQRPYR